MLDERRALRIQAIAALITLPATVLLLGTPLFELGYVLGRPAAALAAARLAPAGKPMQRPRVVITILLGMAAAALPVAMAWREPWAALGLKTYYTAVLLMAALLAVYYSVRLVAYPSRVMAMAAALAPYYLVAVGWALLMPALGATPAAERMLSGDVVFHGFVAHLPADLLTAVVMAFLSGPRGGLRP